MNACRKNLLDRYTFKVMFNKSEHYDFELVYLNCDSDSIIQGIQNCALKLIFH